MIPFRLICGVELLPCSYFSGNPGMTMMRGQSAAGANLSLFKIIAEAHALVYNLDMTTATSGSTSPRRYL